VTTYYVSSTSALQSAAAKAKSGDTISLASGTYDNVNLSNLTFASAITITSTTADHPATLTGLTVRNSTGLTFSNLEFSELVPAKQWGFQITGSSNITLDKLDVHGPANVGSGQESAPLLIRTSSNVTVTNSDFHDSQFGINVLNNNGVNLSNNVFHNLRTDGIRGGGNSNITIAKNVFTDFHPAAGDHADAIQFWTTNTTTATTNLTIDSNLVVRGTGDPIQGIFMRDDVGSLPFTNVTITNNQILGGLYNGIVPGGVTSGTISGNTVLGYADQTSWISVSALAGLSYSNNIATTLLNTDKSTSVIGHLGNVVYTPSAPINETQLVNEWLLTHPANLYGQNPADAAIRAQFGASFTASTVTLQGTTYAHPTGTANADTMTASGNSILDGGAGNDTLNDGTSANAYLLGGLGNDTYIVHTTNTHVLELANSGTDTVQSYVDYTLPSNVEDLVQMGTARLTLTGNALDNHLTANAAGATLYGMDGNDTLTGGAASDYLDGGNGDDTLIGGGGNNTLVGGAGNDTLIGGAGNDILIGGAGNDLMTGGGGSDIFRFSVLDAKTYSTDTITDFVRGLDKIDLSAIDAKTPTFANDAFAFIGTAAFHKVAGELRYDVSGGAAHIYADTNGDGVADFSIILKSITTVSATDFVL
jgi:Ca2+-binding RTX toxin-like protein